MDTPLNITTYPEGNFLFKEKDEAKYIFYILSGYAGIWVKNKKILRVGPDFILGLESVYNNFTYPYSVKTETEIRVRLYNIEAIPEILFSSPILTERVLSSLGKLLFKCWSVIPTLTKGPSSYFIGKIKICSPGEYVIKEGEMSTELYKIIFTEKGLEVIKQGKVLALLKQPGEFFGEIAPILQEARTASVRSVGESILEVYPGEVLKDVIYEYPELAIKIIESLSKRLMETNKLFTQAHKDQKTL